MSKPKKHRRKRVKPDEQFSAGPLEFARFGKLVVGRSNATEKQVKAVQANLAELYPSVVAEIDVTVSAIAQLISRLPPDRLLHRGYWEYAAVICGIGDQNTSGFDQIMALRMIDYLQSVIAAVPSAADVEEVGEDDWSQLRKLVISLFERLTIKYQVCHSAYRHVQDPELDQELERFRVQAESLWLNVRGKRYQVHEQQALLDVLGPHSEIFVELFGIDVTTLSNELEKILSKLTRGPGEAIEELKHFQQEATSRMGIIAADFPEAGVDELMGLALQDEQLSHRGSEAMNNVGGLGLFDVGRYTALPPSLLDALSWRPGEDTDFFAAGEFRGWPLRIWPIMQRPFLRLDDRTLCFDAFSLFDNIYRVLRRIVITRAPAYGELWNERQKEVTERLPFDYLGRLLPGARIYRPVYYWWAPDGGRKQRHEADGLVLYEDHLFIIEVKGGAYTYTSPANDLASHLASLRNLLQAPARQGSRFVDYLESAAEVSIEDADQNETGKLRRATFRQITVCTVTLDTFTTLASGANHLGPVGIDLGPRGIWPVSIDDLRVFAEVFRNPLCFLHYVEQRFRANKSPHVDISDEMDHLGLYFSQNDYGLYAAELMADKTGQLQFNGFRTPIDEYFTAVLQGDTPAPPQQDIPPRLAEVIEFLAHTIEPRRTELASFLLDGDGDFRRQFCRAVDQALAENDQLRRARPLSFYGGMAMSLFVWSPSASRDGVSAERHAQAVMLANHESSRRLVELEYSERGMLIGAHLRHTSLAALATAELYSLREAGLALQDRRIRDTLKTGKIGRNDPCPCGSGSKYKRCHGAVDSR